MSQETTSQEKSTIYLPTNIHNALKVEAILDNITFSQALAKHLEGRIPAIQARAIEHMKLLHEVIADAQTTKQVDRPVARPHKAANPADNRRRITGRRNMPKLTDETRAYICETYIAHPKWPARRVGLSCGGYSPTTVYKVIKEYSDVLKLRGIVLRDLRSLPEAYKRYSTMKNTNSQMNLLNSKGSDGQAEAH